MLWAVGGNEQMALAPKCVTLLGDACSSTVKASERLAEQTSQEISTEVSWGNPAMDHFIF